MRSKVMAVSFFWPNVHSKNGRFQPKVSTWEIMRLDRKQKQFWKWHGPGEQNESLSHKNTPIGRLGQGQGQTKLKLSVPVAKTF